MKSIKTILAALLFTAAIMPCVSCKKESTTPTPKTTREKLLGKWTLVSEVTNNYYSGSPHITTYNYQAGDYLDFKSDGIVINSQSGQTLTLTYGIINDSKIWLFLDYNIYDLKSLTETDLQLYKKDVTGAGYDESTLNLKR